MVLSPGQRFAIAHTPSLLVGPLFSYCALKLCDTFLDLRVGGVATALTLLMTPTALFTLQLVFHDVKNYLSARSLGARLPSYVGDWSPGSLRILLWQINNAKHGYITDNVTISQETTFIMRVLFMNRLITREPEQMKTLLATEFDKYEKGKEIKLILQPFIGDGVFAADGDLWKFHRSMTRPFFTRDRISDFDNFDRHANATIAQLKERLREGYAVDLQDMSARFTLDSATEFLFGHDVASLSSAIPYPHSAPPYLREAGSQVDSSQKFANALAKAQIVLLHRARYAEIWPLFEWKQDNLAPHLKEVHSLIEPIVKQAVENKRNRIKAGEETKIEEETLLQHLVNSTEDPTMLRDEIMSLLLAGRDTTASLISFVVYMLAEHPAIMQRLRTEILTQVGTFKRPSYEDIREMKFLRAVLNETLRLYPPVPFNIRASKSAGTLWPAADAESKPLYIPPNTRILLSVLAMHRRKDLWGPDALEFDPDRFLDERLHTYLTPRPFIFLPFNAGPRICLGQQFAYNEASFFIVRLLQNFSEISLDLGAQPPQTLAPAAWAGGEGRKGKERLRPRTHLTMYLDGGLWVNLKEANADEHL